MSELRARRRPTRRGDCSSGLGGGARSKDVWSQAVGRGWGAGLQDLGRGGGWIRWDGGLGRQGRRGRGCPGEGAEAGL